MRTLGALALTVLLAAPVRAGECGGPVPCDCGDTLTGATRLTRNLGPCDQDGVAVVEDGTLHDVVAAVHGAMHGAFTGPSRHDDLDQLTPTERRVLQSVNEGLSNKEIAQALGVAVPTVKHHVHSLLTKLGVRRRGEAAALYRRNRERPGNSRWPATSRSLRSSSIHPI